MLYLKECKHNFLCIKWKNTCGFFSECEKCRLKIRIQYTSNIYVNPLIFSCFWQAQRGFNIVKKNSNCPMFLHLCNFSLFSYIDSWLIQRKVINRNSNYELRSRLIPKLKLWPKLWPTPKMTKEIFRTILFG